MGSMSKDREILLLIEKQGSKKPLTKQEADKLLDFYRNLDINIAKKMSGTPQEKFERIKKMTHKQRLEAYFGK